MTQLVAGVRTWFGEVIEGWNRFWFEPADPATLGLIRICTGAMLFYTHAVWGLQLSAFFGDHAWASPDAVHLLQKDTYSWSYLWYLHSPWQLWLAHIAALVIFALLTVGLFTRAVSILAFFVTLAYVNRAQGALFG